MISDGWDPDLASEIIGRHVGQPGAMLPILHELQDVFGFIAEDALPAIATALNIGRAEVYGVVSFYHEFRTQPAGRHVLKLCRAEACQAMGGEALAGRALTMLGIDWGGTTPDGRLTVESVFCLGLCASAPAALLDKAPTARLTSDKLERLVATCPA